jgi:hypothetical protein
LRSVGSEIVRSRYRLKSMGGSKLAKRFRFRSYPSGEDNRTIMEFSDAELTAILRRRVGVVQVESDEQRPEGEPLN